MACSTSGESSVLTMSPTHISADFILLKRAIFTMKEDQLYMFGGVVCPETYLGTRMNQKALLFHTQLHDWSDAQNLTHTGLNTKIINSARQKDIHLPVKKLAQIEYWTRDVNKYYHPRRPGTAKAGSFMYIDVSKYNIKDAGKVETLRPKSAIVSSSRPGQRPVSAITTGSGPRRRFFGTDVHTIHNHLVESQFHYSALRKNIYSSKSSKEANTISADIKESLKNVSSPRGTSTYESETTSTLGNSVGTKTSDLESQGKDQSLANPQIIQPVITSRSWSNKMLNVISIDDCKLTCRYRPQKIKEARGPAIDYEEIDKQKEKASKREYKNTAMNVDRNQSDSQDADDEDDSDVVLDMNNIHLSPDRNNNEITHQIIITEATPRNDNSDSDIEYLPNIDTSHTIDKSKNTSDEQQDKENGMDETDNFFSETQDLVNGQVEKQILKQNEVDLANEEIQNIMNSQGTASKTSYGRITTLYSNSETTKKTKPVKKKTSRTQRINHAIDDMIGERKVMNSMTKDFDKRVAEFGRTIIDKQEGSENFKKMHTHLRRKMDQFMEYKGAMKTKQFFDRRRLNSNSNSIASGAEKV